LSRARIFQTLAVVPARGGSKGLPGKNKRLLHGKPLTWWTLSFCETFGFDKFTLSSDDEEILDFGKNFASCLALRRPEVYSSDTATDQDVLIHAVKEVKGVSGVEFDRVVMLQPTAPARDPALLRAALELHSRLPNPDASSVWSVSKVPEKHHWMKQIHKVNDTYSIRTESRQPPRRQDLTQAFIRSGDFYVIGREALEDPFLAGDRLEVMESAEPPINIDSVEDFFAAERLLSVSGSKLVRSVGVE